MRTKKDTTSLCPMVEKKPGCIKAALAILGDKWTLLLVGHLLGEAHTFAELEALLPGVSPRTLSERLTRLTEEKIIEAELYCARPKRYRYSPTEKGKELRAVLLKMAAWGEKYR